mgnify:CR=1 FL=1
MARPSRWRLAPVDRIRVPTVLASQLEDLAVAIDKNKPEIAQEILDAVVQKYCECPATAPQESTFTIPAPIVPERQPDPYALRLEDDEPIPDTVLSAAFQPETPVSDTETERQLLEHALAQNSNASLPDTALTEPETLTATAAIADNSTATTDGVTGDVTTLKALLTELETVEPPVAIAVADESIEPKTPAVNLDVIADTLQLVAAFSHAVSLDSVGTLPENTLATARVVTATAAVGADVTVADALPTPEAAVEAPETTISEAVETVTETPEAGPVASQIDSATTAETVLQVEPITVASAVTRNDNETVATAPTATQLADAEGFSQESASPTLDVTDVPVAPVTLTTNVESVEPLAADSMSSGRKLSTPTEVFPPVFEPGQNVELAIVDQDTTVESAGHAFVESEPSFRHSLVEPQNKRPEITNGAVSTPGTDLELPATSDSTVNVQAPLSFRQESKEASIELGAETRTADKIVTEHSTNGSVEQVLKMPASFEQSADLISGANTLGVLGANQTTVTESLPERLFAEPIVETTNLAVEKVAVTPKTPLPEPQPPVDKVQELATFAELLFNTWQRLTLAKRGELVLCWGLQVSFDYLFREGFTHMTAYRFFVLLEALLQSETDYAYGCLQVLHKGPMEPVTLNGQLFNRLTFYAPGTPKHEQNQAALKQAQRVVALQPTEGSEQELERIRKERNDHLEAVTQTKVNQNRRQNQTQKLGGMFGALTQLKQRLLS